MKKLIFVLAIFSCLGAIANDNEKNLKQKKIREKSTNVVFKSHFSPCREAATGKTF